MQRLKIDQDIKPLSEIRTGITNFIKQVHNTKRPLIITQHGKGVAVLIDANEYEAMQEKIELLTDVQTSLNQIEKGQDIDHEDVAMITADELAGILETAHLLRSPVNAKRLLTALDKVRKQSGTPQTIEDLRTEVGFE